MTELLLRFPRSRIYGFQRVLELAQQGAFQEEADGSYSTRFLLPGDPVALQPITQLVTSLRGIKRATVEINGLQVDALKAAMVLDCYGQSLQVSDPRGHCWVISPRPDGLLWPCRLAGPYINCRGVEWHPSSVRAQVESALVVRGCAWCPQLRLNEWELEHIIR